MSPIPSSVFSSFQFPVAATISSEVIRLPASGTEGAAEPVRFLIRRPPAPDVPGSAPLPQSHVPLTSLDASIARPAAG